MSQSTAVSIHVLNSDSDPVEGAFLTFGASQPPLPEMALVTNSQGIVRMALPLGSYRVAAQKDASYGEVDFQIEPSSPPKKLTIILQDADAASV